jgi:hypothetical protein
MLEIGLLLESKDKAEAGWSAVSTRFANMSKKKIALFAVGGLGSLLLGLALYAYYDFTHNFRFSFTSEQVSDAQIALKGSIGEAIFSGQRSEAVPDVQHEGKTGLDAVLAPPPAGSKGVGLIEAYQKDPQRFKRYAEMFDSQSNPRRSRQGNGEAEGGYVGARASSHCSI